MEKENRGDSRPVAPSPKFDHIMVLPEVSLGPGAQAFPIGVDEDEGDEGDAVYFQNCKLYSLQSGDDNLSILCRGASKACQIESRCRSTAS